MAAGINDDGNLQNWVHGRVSEGWKYFLGMLKYFPLWPGALAGWQGGLATSGARGSGASSDSGGQEAAPGHRQHHHAGAGQVTQSSKLVNVPS